MKKYFKMFLSILTAAVIAVSSLVFPASAKKSSGFIHVSGENIVDENGNNYLIKAICFGNNIWTNPSYAPKNFCNESSYKELAALGFNSVRFFLNYGIFESDDEPYKYRQSGFDWLDRNIAYAKKYNIRLILNMHYPQGGYQSNGEGTALWTDKNNQKRLAALWAAIAKRYADEPTIMGYGIVNEPQPIGKTISDGLKNWQKLAQNITDSIRKYDKNHIVFIEKVGCIYTDKGAVEITPDKYYVRIKDSNLAYEFHYYDPFQYTNQGNDNLGGSDSIKYTYPGEGSINTAPEWVDAVDSEPVSNAASGWQYIETPLYKVKDEKYNVLGISFETSYLGESGICYADLPIIYEYDETGKLVKEHKCNEAIARGEFGLWSIDESGTAGVSKKIGYDDKICAYAKGTLSFGNIGIIRAAAVKGHSYKAAGYVRTENVSSDASVYISLSLYHSDIIEEVGLDKESLEKTFLSEISYCKKNKLPIFCGECGLNRPCFEGGRGGEKWVADIIDIMHGAGVGFTYHDYCSSDFGFYYYNDNNKLTRNDALAKVFAEKFGGKYAPAAFSLKTKNQTDINTLFMYSPDDRAYTGKEIRPVIEPIENEQSLKPDIDFTLSYKNNKKIGTATVTIKGINAYKGTKTFTFKIIPPKTELRVKKTGNSYKLTWNKVSGIDKYEIEYSDDGGKTFTSGGSVSGKSTTKTIKLGSGKTYLFRIRSFKTVKNVRYYSSWSRTSSDGDLSGVTRTAAELKGKKVVALTFDDGTNDVSTPKLLDVLEKYNIKASFFVVGYTLYTDGGAAVTRAYDLGCEINSHSFMHYNMTTLYASEVKYDTEKTANAIHCYTGEYPKFFRPPYIAVNKKVYDIIDMPFIAGTGCEEESDSVKQRAQRIIDSCEDGAILLLHDAYGDNTNIEALKIAIPELQKKGFEFVTVSELFNAKGITPSSTKEIIYNYATKSGEKE